MENELIPVLAQLHRVIIKDVKELVEEVVGEEGKGVRREMNTGFDRLYHEMDIVKAEYAALKAAVKRIEDHLKIDDCRTDRASIREELNGAKKKIVTLQRKIAAIEAEL